MSKSSNSIAVAIRMIDDVPDEAKQEMGHA
jgi:hypothetical protein